jgi:hypothetical protein
MGRGIFLFFLFESPLFQLNEPFTPVPDQRMSFRDRSQCGVA